MAIDVLKTIWPEWHIEKQIGRGSYGVVYKAVRIDHNIESYAAIKIISIPADESEVDTLRSEGLNINATRTYFQGIVDDCVREIQLMESMKGIQNVVSVEDYKVIEKTDKIGWDIYIRMELLIPFNTYICDKKLTEQEIIKIGSDICSALEICSKRNIIHRDIKPENMFINDFGYFKLGDFGIARKLENMTGGLSQKGTFNYMAPEVTNRIDYDARVDIYSLGIVLYRLLNGNRLPFLDSEKQLLNPNERRNAIERRIRGEALPVPCGASPAMANLILRACAFDPNQRFSSATEMKQALIDVCNGTYQVVDINLDKTTSVRQPPASYDKTTSVRQAQIHDDKTAHSINTFGNMPRKKSNLPKIISAILAVAIIAGVGIFVVPKFINNKNETNEANTSKITESSNLDEEQISAIISEAEKLAAAEDYEGALNKVQDGLVTYPESEELKKKSEEYTSSLNKKIKEKNLTKASDLAEKGDYVSAIALIKNAQETHGNNAEYQSAFKTYSSAYKTEVIDSADGLAANGDYVGAIQKISEATVVVGEDSELIQKSQIYESTYTSEVISQVDALITAREFDSAEETLDAAIKVFPNNQQLKEEKIVISNNEPKELLSVCPPYQYNTDLYTEYSGGKTFNMCGESYTNGFTFYENIYDDAWAYFNLGGKYSALEFDVGHVDGYLMKNRTLNIYYDGELGYTMTLVADAMVQHITLDITDIKQIRIEIPETSDFFGADTDRAVYGFANMVVY